MAYGRQYGYGGIAPNMQGSTGVGYGVAQIGISMAEAMRSHLNMKRTHEAEMAKRAMMKDQFQMQVDQFQAEREQAEKSFAQREEQLRLEQQKFDAAIKEQEAARKERKENRKEDIDRQEKADFRKFFASERSDAIAVELAKARMEADAQKYDKMYGSGGRGSASAKQKRSEKIFQISEVYRQTYEETYDSAMGNIAYPTPEDEERAKKWARKRAEEEAARERRIFNMSVQHGKLQGIEGTEISDDDFATIINSPENVVTKAAEELSADQTYDDIMEWNSFSPTHQSVILSAIAGGEDMIRIEGIPPVAVEDEMPFYESLRAEFPEVDQALTEREKVLKDLKDLRQHNFR